MQQTLKTQIQATDIGLHSGKDIEIIIRPAPEDHGIIFVRSDITDRDNVIPALWNYVVNTQFCTVIGNKSGVTVSTIEHLMAALRGCGIDNALIEVNGSEVPVMDGSSMPFVKLIEEAGTCGQFIPRRVIKILKDITVKHDDKIASLSPSKISSFGGGIDFNHPEIGKQHFEVQLLNGNFKHDLANARTFGFLHEVEYLRSKGLALGGSLANAIVLDLKTIINPDGLRYKNEFIRHKLLDAVGDLYLAGGQIIGAYDSEKPGHAINNALLSALFSDEKAWEFVDLGEINGETGTEIFTDIHNVESLVSV
ncbi:MAG: UDP-3-O-acyl-N-acetylglucosamine deacetylase [Alphaproteobacteria bacterium]|nr:UDP-3-O-acyl-N-acetylglucosamine deacetylase [Alphaproteobacteria bacterium]